MAKRRHESEYRITADDKTGKAFRSVRQRLNKLAKSTAKFGAASAAVAGAGLVYLTKSSFETQDALAKQADAIGANVKNLAALQQQSVLTGGSKESLNKALVQATKRLGEFATTGAGTAAPILKKLGLNTEELIKLKPDELFLRYGESIRGLNNRSEQLAATNLLLGDRTGVILNMIDQGAGEFEKIRGEVDRYSIALSRVDIAKLEQANDALFKARSRTEGIGNVIAAKTAPLITAMANEFLQAGGDAEKMGNTVDSSIDGIVAGAGVVADAFFGWRLVISGVRAEFAEFVADAQDLAEEFTPDVDFFGGAKQLGESLGFVNAQRREEALTTEQVRNLTRETADEMQRVYEQLVNSQKPSEKFAEFVRKAREDAEATAQATVDTINARSFQDPTGGLSFSDDDKEKEREQKERERLEQRLAQRFATVQAYLRTEEEAEIFAYERRLAFVNEFFDNQAVPDEVRRNEVLQGLQEKHEKALTKISNKGLTDRQKFQKKSLDLQVKQVAGSLAQMTQGVATSSRSMFEINKAASIANAVVNTAQGVTQALAAYPPPISFVMAAAQLAAGVAQISAIRSTSFGSGTTPSAVGTSPTINDQPVAALPSQQQAQPVQPQAIIQITLAGDVYGFDDFQDTIKDAISAAADNGEVLFSGETEQAEVIRNGTSG